MAASDLNAERMAGLDDAFGLTESGNAEIAHQWLLAAIRAGYRRADDRLERYLTGIGRRKLIAPLYEALAADAGRARASARHLSPGAARLPPHLRRRHRRESSAGTSGPP